jgi:outer membrane lipoprotein SlyB
MITKELRADPAKSDTRPLGLVASVPLGGGGKMETGSSSKIGKDAPTTSDRWEIVIRLDDGRLRVVNVTEQPEVQVGDKVRVEANGGISPR